MKTAKRSMTKETLFFGEWVVKLKHYAVGIGAFKNMNVRLEYKPWMVYYDEGLTPQQALEEDFKN